MRIITGEFRGRKIDAPSGMYVRPTSDMMKENMFNVLMHETAGAVVIDLFAGTGNLGLEAISRGAKKCYFCDKSRESIKFIKKNISICGAEDRSEVIFGDYRKCLNRVSEPVNLIFMDPPYGSGVYEKAIEEIDSIELLADNGIIIAEHDKHLALPETIGNMYRAKEKRYGNKMLTFYKNTGKEKTNE